MRLSGIVATVCLVTLLSVGAAFAAYPQKPVSLVAPFGAGGVSDLEGRAFAQAAQKYLGQPVMVVNKTGGAGVVGSQFVRTSRPDGYTMLVGRIGPHGSIPAMNMTCPYKWDQFTIIGILQEDPVGVVVRADSPYKTLADLKKAILENPGKLAYGSSGPLGMNGMAPLVFVNAMGGKPTDVKMISYGGGGETIAALMGGHIDFLATNLAECGMPQLRAGQFRALAVTSAERWPDLPDTPTVRELGLQELEFLRGWTGLYGPEKLPKEVVDKWSEVIQKVAKDADWLRMTHDLASVPSVKGPAESKAYVKKQIEMYDKLGDKLGIKILK